MCCASQEYRYCIAWALSEMQQCSSWKAYSPLPGEEIPRRYREKTYLQTLIATFTLLFILNVLHIAHRDPEDDGK
jgi:hypothetical protein